MAKGTFQIVAPVLFDLEKGYVHRSSKADPGGPTNYGITLETFRAWNGDWSLNRNALMAMPKSEALKIYKAQYWDTIRADDMPRGVDMCVFDFAVNSGPGRAVMELQELLKIKQDGIVGIITLNKIKTYPGRERKLIGDLCANRLKFMKGLSNWRYNKNGWTNRVETVLKESRALVTSKDHRPDMVAVTQTPKANSQNMSVSKALFSKENATVLTVAIPAVSGLLTNFPLAQYTIAAFIAAFGSLALYWTYKKVRKAAI